MRFLFYVKILIISENKQNCSLLSINFSNAIKLFQRLMILRDIDCLEKIVLTVNY